MNTTKLLLTAYMAAGFAFGSAGCASNSASSPKAEPKAAEVQSEPKLDNGPGEEKTAASEKKAAPAPAPAPAPAEDPQVKLPCEHVVHTGDSLWRIAQKYYGRGSLWKQIYEANKAEIKNKDMLEPGTVLKIPAVK